MSAEFHGRLAETLGFGHILEIGAMTECDASWFSISLATAKRNECETFDIGLCIAVYLRDDQIVYKQQINNKWLEVASDDFDTAMFRQHFKVILVMDDKKFHIGVNSERLSLVKYAVDVKELNTVHIVGDLAYIKQMDHRQYFPSIWPPIQLTHDRLDFSHDIPLMLQPGHVMVITMKLLGKMNGRFHLNFRNIWNCKRQEVHISARFDSKKIARNSKLPVKRRKGNPDKMEFGTEETETEGTFPFDLLPTTFKFAIGFTATSLRMAKDGAFLFDYAFRTPNVLCDLSGVNIMGINGMTVRVRAIDHFRLQDPLCNGFELYSDS